MDQDAVLLSLSTKVGELNANSTTLFKEITSIKKHLIAIEERLDEEAKEYNYTRGKMAFIYIGFGIIITLISTRIMAVFS